MIALLAAALAKPQPAASVSIPEPDTITLLLSCAPTLSTQLTLMVIQAVWWAVVIPVIAGLFAVWVKKQPWCEQWTALNKATFKKVLLPSTIRPAQAHATAALFSQIA